MADKARELKRLNQTAADLKAERRRKVTKMLRQRMSVADIAAELGVPERTIRKDCEEIRHDWLQASREDIASIIARELDDLNDMERMAIKAFEEERRIAASSNRAPDPRWIRARLEVKGHRARLLGIDDREFAREVLRAAAAGAAVGAAVANATQSPGNEGVVIDVSDMSPEEIAAAYMALAQDDDTSTSKH